MPPRKAPTSEQALDQTIRQVESGVMGIATSEVLWGGPRGDGLVHTVTRLAQSVESLGATVTTLATQVTGENGISAQLADLKKDHARLQATVDKAITSVTWIFGSLAIPGTIYITGSLIRAVIVGHF